MTVERPSEGQNPREELRGNIHAPSLRETGFANAPRDVRDPVEGILKVMEQAMHSFGKINESLAKSALDPEGVNKLIAFASKAGINSRFVTDFLQNLERSGAMILKQVRGEIAKQRKEIAPEADTAKNEQYATLIQNELSRTNDACPQGRLNGEAFGKAIGTELNKAPEPKIVTLAMVVAAAKTVSIAMIAEYQRAHPATPAPAPSPSPAPGPAPAPVPAPSPAPRPGAPA
jgi:hypothetical protein